MSSAALAFPLDPALDLAPTVADPVPVKRKKAWIAARPGLTISAAWIALLLIASLIPALLTSVDPLAADARLAFLGPNGTNWLGTDENGRDLLSRMIHGTGSSLFVGAAATVIGLGIGAAIGLMAALGGRWADQIVSRFLDALMAFPDQLLALVIITFFGQGTLNLVLAIAFSSVPRNARLVRAQALVVRGSGYVEAARTLGLPSWKIVWRHILPNALKPIFVIMPLTIGNAIAASAALSFLGFGAPPPAPEWGSILSSGRNYLPEAWWLTAVPALAITLTVLAITVIGRAWRNYSEGRAW